MTRIAKFAMRGPLYAATMAALLLLSSFFPVLLLGALGAFPAFLLVVGSSAVIALVVLRVSDRVGWQAALVGAVLVSAMSLLIGGRIQESLILVGIFWLPSGIAASVLRRTVSLNLAVSVLGGLAVIAVLVIYVIEGDPAARWQGVLSVWFEQMVATFEQTGAPLTPQQQADLQQFTRVMASIMTGAAAAMLVWVATLGLMLGRCWQARLYNPGGFKPEFHSLRFGRGLATGSILVCILAIALQWPVLTSVSTVVMAVFLFQGLAVIHSLVQSRGMSQGWLVGVYMMLILVQTSLLLGALGLADNWLNLRKLK